MTSSRFLSINYLIFIGTILGIITGFFHNTWLLTAADVVSKVVINLLSLISIPIIFLSIVSTISGMQSLDEIKVLGRKVLKYTISTTLVAATLGLILYIIINPARYAISVGEAAGEVAQSQGYLTFFLNIFPPNLVKTFSDGNVVGVVFIALLLSIAILGLPDENKNLLHNFFSSLFGALLNVTYMIVYLMPFGVWAFMTLFVENTLKQDWAELISLGLYVLTIILANLGQALIVLPLWLLWKGISPLKALKGMSSALTLAFFSRSSNAALPVTLNCVQKNLGVSAKVARFTIPLCSTINMNACAAFILITVLFVSAANGVHFSWLNMFMWIIISTTAAVGNAGVPMGCYFLTTALLISMGVPLNILWVILPLYTLIDMLETAVNVWSDACVALMVDKEVKQASSE